MAARRGGRVFLWIVMALLAVSLLGFGTGNLGVGRTASIGRVDGLDLDAQDYANEVNRQLGELSQVVRQPLTLEQAREQYGLDLQREALAALVTRRVLDAEAARLGLSLGDRRIAEAVQADPDFQGLSGEFDRELYREQLSRQGRSERDHEDGLREGTARAILQAAVVSGLPEPRAVAERLAAWSGERRSVTWAELAADAVAPTVPAPTEAERRAWYDAHPGTYTAPEVRDVSYAWVTPEMIREAQEVDEAEVRALYDERIDEFVQEERRLVERLVFGDEAGALAARARLDAGEADFEALVEERGLLLSDVDLGDQARGELGPAAEAVFAAQPGDVVGPLPSDLGPALFRVNAVLAADETTFEEAAADLRAELASEAARRVISEEVARIEDLAAGGATVEDLAEQTLLEPGTIAWSEGVADGPAAYQPFREAVEAAAAEGFPEVIELGDGGVAVLRVNEITPPALRPYEEVAAQVEDDARADAVRLATLAQAEARAQAIAGGASFEEQGLAPRVEGPRTRRDVIEGAPEGTVAAAFAMEPGQAQALPSPGGAVILRLDAVEPAPEGDPAVEAEREDIARQVSGAVAQDLFETFARQLQMNSEVRIDEAAAAAVAAQFQ
jgi:peptidyl-prolyl cis-trans isomerase D